MVLSQVIKSRLQPKMDSIGRFLGNRGITPDVLTALGFALALVAGFLFASKPSQSFLAALAILGSAVMDLLNGAVARATHKSLGSLDDSTFDRLSDIAMYAGIIYGGYHVPPTIVVLTLGFSLLPSYMRAKGESLGITVTRFGVGERADRLMALIAFSLAGYVSLGIYLNLALGVIDSVQRYVYVFHAIGEKEKAGSNAVSISYDRE